MRSDDSRYSHLTSRSTASEDEIEVYTMGCCHLLALAMHRKFGWSLLTVESGEESYVASYEDNSIDEVPCVLHVYAVDDHGQAWDIVGSRAFADVRKEAAEVFCTAEQNLSIDHEFSEKSFVSNYVSDENNDKPLGDCYSVDELNKDIDEAMQKIETWFPQLRVSLNKEKLPSNLLKSSLKLSP